MGKMSSADHLGRGGRPDAVHQDPASLAAALYNQGAPQGGLEGSQPAHGGTPMQPPSLRLQLQLACAPADLAFWSWTWEIQTWVGKVQDAMDQEQGSRVAEP